MQNTGISIFVEVSIGTVCNNFTFDILNLNNSIIVVVIFHQVPKKNMFSVSQNIVLEKSVRVGADSGENRKQDI